VSNYVL